MSTTVAAIAADAFDDVAAEITGVVQSCTLTRTTQGAYNTTTGAHATTTTTATGRAVFDTMRPVEDVLPGYVAGPGETLVWLEGLSTAPKENDAISIGGVAHTVKAVGDIAGAGTFFAAMVVGSS